MTKDEFKPRIIVFTYSKGWNDTFTEEVEFDSLDDDKDIQEVYENWVWEQIGDKFSWGDKQN